MERRGLKTVLILILILLNIFLLSYLLWQYRMERLFQQKTREEITALFALDGVALSPDVFRYDAPPEKISLAPDEVSQREAAVFFLGETDRTEQGNGRYRSGAAAAEFFPNGEFTVTGLSGSAESLFQNFCRACSYEQTGVPDLSGQTLIAAARYEGIPVFNCRVTFSCAPDGALREVSGVLLSRSVSPARTETFSPRVEAFPLQTDAPNAADRGNGDQDAPPLNAFGALSVFQNARRKNRLSASSVFRLSPCYALEGLDSGEMELIPAWKVETDVLNYYINALTGALTAG